MTETKWTKGPWQFEKVTERPYGSQIIIFGDGKRLAAVDCGLDDEEGEATARLMTTAPDLYAALDAEKAAKDAEWQCKIARVRFEADDTDAEAKAALTRLEAIAVRLRDAADDLSKQAMAKARGEA